MSLETELKAYVEAHSRRRASAARNARLIAVYYGFGDLEWPTYEEVGKQFSLTRERVRQIIDDGFRNHAKAEMFPLVLACSDVIRSNRIISSSDLQERIFRENLSGRKIGIRGLLSLLHDLDLCRGLDAVDFGFNAISRDKVQAGSEFFLVDQEYARAAKKALHKATTLPGQLGLAKLDDLRGVLREFGKEISETVVELLRSTEHCRFIEAAGTLWYTLENRDNTLINRCEKIFAVVRGCAITQLAAVLANSLQGRSQRFEYPDASVIELFIRDSRYFRLTSDAALFLGEKGSLTNIETDLHEFLGTSSPAIFEACDAFLEGRGHKRPNRLKAITASPLVFVDRTGGRKKYRYCAIVEADFRFPESESDADRYNAFKQRLEEIDHTDVAAEAIRRREQWVLQEWLFDRKQFEVCAICGENFSVGALVAAHKKKRSLCTEAERLDPYIVMPLCKFGCDYLYEEGIVAVVSGRIAIGNCQPQNSAEYKRAQLLLGRKIPDNWLRGDHAYFDSRRRLDIGVSRFAENG